VSRSRLATLSAEFDGNDMPLTGPIYQVKADLFKTLGHPARIRVLELLRDRERSVSELVTEVGLEPSHLSQQLAVLRRANLVQTRKVGSSVIYSVADPKIFELMEVAKAILTTTLSDTRELLAGLASLEFAPPAKARPRKAKPARSTG
jgi:DNA-binding transcriptional ArsR family regulator